MNQITHNPHSPEAKIAKTNMLRRHAAVRREQADKSKDVVRAARFRNDAAALEKQADALMREARNIKQGGSDV